MMRKRIKSFLLILLMISMPAFTVNAFSETWNGFVSVEVGWAHTVAIKADGSLWAWGMNDDGEIGDGTTTNKQTPTKIGSNDWRSISAGRDYNIAIKSNGSLWAWGNNLSGYVNDTTVFKIPSPTQIGTDNDWAHVSAGTSHNLALKDNGTLWAWGDNSGGMLGDGTNTRRTVPVQIGTDSGWAMISAGDNHSTAVKTNGTLWVWGSNSGKQNKVPTQVGTDSDWAYVSAGVGYTVAVKTNGTLWAWGENDCGQLGDGTKIDRKDAPVQIASDTNWRKAFAGNGTTAALKNDGSLWMWGSNKYAQLGDGTKTDKLQPMQIGSDNDWTNVGAYGDHTLAIKTNGSLWAWGHNTYGRLGDGTTTERVRPILICGPVTGVTIKKTAIEIPVSYPVALTAIVEPSQAANRAVTWKSSDESIATVDGKGRVVGIAIGETVITVTTVEGGFTASCNVSVIKNVHGIDYESIEDIIVLGSSDGFSINLTQETITIPDTYTPVIYSLDGGTKWKDVKSALSTANFSKLLNKDFTLQLADKPIDRATKKPVDGAKIVSFAQVNKRPSAPSLIVNYDIGADLTGVTTGDWLLTEKNGTNAVKDNIQIGVAIASGKTVDNKGFGQFFPGLTNGIPVKSLTGSKVEKTSYFIRYAPKQNGQIYTAASKPKKITVTGEQKAPNYKVTSKSEKKSKDGTVKTPASASVKLKKGDLIIAGATEDIGAVPEVAGSATVTLTEEIVLQITGDKGAVVSVKDVSGAITIWKAATSKKPASAKQTIKR